MNSFDIDNAARAAIKGRPCYVHRNAMRGEAQAVLRRVRAIEREKAEALAQYDRQRRETLAWLAGLTVLLGLIYAVGQSALFWLAKMGLDVWGQ